jgi:hypothetical protein
MIIGISGKIGSGKDTVGGIIQLLSSGYTSKDKKQIKMMLKGVKFDDFWQIKKFADKLKEITALLIGCTREQLEDREFKEKELGEEWWYYGAYQHGFGFNKDKLVSIHIKVEDAEYILKFSHMNRVELIKLTPRKILQLLGTEAGREIIHPNIWVNALMSEYKDKRWISKAEVDVEKGLPYNLENDKPIYPNWIITDMRFPNELEAVKSRGGITIRINRISDEAGQYETKEHPSETALDNSEFDYVIDNNGTIVQLIEKVKEILVKENIL